MPDQTLQERMVALHDHAQKLQLKVHTLLAETVHSVGTLSIEDLCDTGFLMREIGRILKDLKDGLESKQGIVSRVLASRAATAALQNEMLDLRGKLCSATPEVKTKPIFPKEGTDDYSKLMRWIGVSNELIDSPLLRPSFKGLEAELTKRMALGEPAPPGVISSFTEVTVVYRKRTGKKRKDENGNEEDE